MNIYRPIPIDGVNTTATCLKGMFVDAVQNGDLPGPVARFEYLGSLLVAVVVHATTAARMRFAIDASTSPPRLIRLPASLGVL